MLHVFWIVALVLFGLALCGTMMFIRLLTKIAVIILAISLFVQWWVFELDHSGSIYWGTQIFIHLLIGINVASCFYSWAVGPYRNHGGDLRFHTARERCRLRCGKILILTMTVIGYSVTYRFISILVEYMLAKNDVASYETLASTSDRVLINMLQGILSTFIGAISFMVFAEVTGYPNEECQCIECQAKREKRDDDYASNRRSPTPLGSQRKRPGTPYELEELSSEPQCGCCGFCSICGGDEDCIQSMAVRDMDLDGYEEKRTSAPSNHSRTSAFSFVQSPDSFAPTPKKSSVLTSFKGRGSPSAFRSYRSSSPSGSFLSSGSSLHTPTTSSHGRSSSKSKHAPPRSDWGRPSRFSSRTTPVSSFHLSSFR